MAEMIIKRIFKARHGTKEILQSDYEVQVTTRGPIILGFTNHCDSIRIEEKLDTLCLKLENCYLDDVMGRATHEMIGLWFFNHIGIDVDEISINSDGMLVKIHKEDYLRYNYESVLFQHKAMTAILKEKLSEAESLINLSIQRDTNNANSYLIRGRIYRYTQRFCQAASDFQKVISLCPQWSEGYRNMGNMALFLGEYDKMIPYFKKAVRLAPYSSLAQNNLGYAYKILKNYKQGYIYCHKAIELKPDYYEAHMDLSEICRALKLDEEAALHWSIGKKLQEKIKKTLQIADPDDTLNFM